jgi:hypothetical protein
MPSAAPVASEVRRRSDSARHSPRRAPHPSLFNPKRRRSTSRLFRPEDADAESDALAVPLATRSAAQPAPEVPRATQGAPSTANLLDALKQRNNLTREETQEVISLLQRHGQGFDAAADAAGPSTAAMPPPAPVGLFQTPSSAGPSAARSPAGPASETAFSNIRSYIQHANAERRRAPLSLPNARGVSRHPALGYGGARGARSLYGTQEGHRAPSLLGAPAGLGHAETAARATRGFGVGAGARAAVRYGGPNSPPTASGIGMDWRAPASGPGLLSPGVKRSRDTAEMDTHAREVGRSTVARLTGAGDARRAAPAAMPSGTPAGSSLKATPGDRSAGKSVAASAVTTDTARRILQTLDRLAGQKSGAETDGALASPAAKPTNLSSSLNKAAAPSSSLHGFRGIQRATPAKSLASAEKRVSAPIASHSKPKPAPATRVAAPSALQFEPDAFKETKTPSAPSPAGFGNFASAAAAKPAAPPALLFSAPPPSTGAAGKAGEATNGLPAFTFGDADTVPKNASPLASAPSPVAERDLPNYTFGEDGEDDEDEPTFTFGGRDDGVIDAPGVGSPDVPEVDVKYTFGEGASAPPAAAAAPTPAAAPKAGGLWSAEALKKNAEHQAKVNAAIEEEESKGKGGAPSAAAPAAPSLFAAPSAAAPSPFSFGVAAPAKTDAAPAAAPKAGGLWSAEALKKNAEHQAKVNAAIEEEESKGKGGAPSAAAPAAPSAAAPSPFSFGVAAPAKTDAAPAAPAAAAPAPFSFGLAPAEKPKEPEKPDAAEPPPPAAPAPFSFGLAPAEKPKEPEKPAAAEPPPPAAPAAFSFGAPAPAFGKPETEKPADTPAAPAPAPFTFGAPVEKPASKPEEPPAKPAETPAAAPFTFGAPASTPAASAATAPLSASAPAFTFGAVPEPKATDEPAAAPAPAFAGFGAPATASKDADAPKPAAAAPFTFGAPASAAAPASGAGLFGGASSDSLAPSFGATDNAPAPAPASTPFTFGSAPASDFGASSAPAATETAAPAPSTGAFTFGAAAAPAASSAAPAFGAPSSTLFGASAPAPAFGAASSAPASGGGFGSGGGGFGFGTSQPAASTGSFAFGATGASSAPAPSATPFGSSAPAFGAAAPPAFGAAASNPFGGADAAAAAPGPFGGGGAFGSSAPAFGSSGNLSGAFGAPAATGAAAANPFGGGGGGFGAAPDPAFGGGGGFGGGAPPPANTPSMFGGVPGGGMSMGAGDAPAGGRKPVKKARRPPRRNG